MRVNKGAQKPDVGIRPLELEGMAVVAIWVLGTELWPCRKEVTALNS